MPAKRPRRPSGASDRTAAVRDLADRIVECAAVTVAHAARADDALRAVLTAIPPSTDRRAAAQLADAIADVRASARKGRNLARRLSALVAPAE